VKSWVRQWIEASGGNPDEMRASYLAVGMTDEDYERGVVSLYPSRTVTSSGMN